MSFFSLAFPLFFLAVFIAHWSLRRWRTLDQLVLLSASYGFYASWNPPFVLLLFLFSSLMVFVASRLRTAPAPVRRSWMLLALVAAVGNLGFFRYYEFFRVGMEALLSPFFSVVALPAVDVALPVGISFFTLQGLTYVFAVERQQLKGRYNPLEVLLFIAFFPTLLSGPISRATGLLPQIHAGGFSRLIEGERALILLLSGLLKKVVISSYLAMALVDPVFNNPDEASGALAWLALYGYALQIYCDFSGYTDLATGIALLLGFRLPRNFDRPYMAENLREFWRRWHISLSSWIRDYLYVPLGGSRHGLVMTCRNLFFVMMVSGLWHGPRLSFMVWGAWHGAGMVGVTLWKRWQLRWGLSWPDPRLGHVLAVFLTFHFVALGWVFFRAPGLGEALAVFQALGRDVSFASLSPLAVGVVAGGLALHQAGPALLQSLARLLQVCPLWVRPWVLGAGAYLFLQMGPDGVPAFIYYQF
ncbi:putative alginate O-acetylase [Gammaproteobacteria bacterium]